MSYRWRKKKGVSIAMVLMITLVILVIGFSISAVSFNNINLVNRDKNNTQAFYAAEAGLSRAISKVKATPSWNGKESDGQTLTYSNAPILDSNVKYTVWVYNNLDGSGCDASQDYMSAFRGIHIPRGTCYIVCAGNVGDIDEKSAQFVGVLLKYSNPFARFGLFGDDWIQFNGNVTIDSYDSATGQKVEGQADVGTNGTVVTKKDETGNDMTSPAVVLKGNSASLDGSLYAGVGADKSTAFDVKHDENTITGDLKILSQKVPMPVVSIPSNLMDQSQIIAGNSGIFVVTASPTPSPVAEEEKSKGNGNNGNGNNGNGNNGNGNDSNSSGSSGESSSDSSSSSGNSGNSGSSFALPASNSSPSSADVVLPAGIYNAELNISNHRVVELVAGTYVFKGIDVAGQGELRANTTNGTVKIYMDGNINLTGGGNCGLISNYNGNGVPRATDLLIYGTEKCITVNIRGNSDACFGLYAPNADVNMRGNSTLWGGFIAKTLWVHGHPTIHYDTALGRVSGDVSVIEVGSWQIY